MGKVAKPVGTKVNPSLRINDYLNDRPAPTGTVDKGSSGGGFTVVDNRFRDVATAPRDGKAQQLERSVLARKLSGDRLPIDPREAAMKIVREFEDRAHISDAAPLAFEAYSRCAEFAALGKDRG